MIHTDLRDQYEVTFNVRPVKIAYFFWNDDSESLERILHFVCTQWGGIRHLIIPVQRNLEIAPVFQHLLKYHEPDRYVEHLTDLKKRGLEEHNWLLQYLRSLFPYKLVNIQYGHFFEEHDDTMHALSIIDLDKYKGARLLSLHLNGGLPNRLKSLAIFGKIYSGQEQDYAEVFNIERQAISVNSLEFWTRQFSKEHFDSVINLTAFGFSPYTITDFFDANNFNILFVDSISSLCVYWNYRATIESGDFGGSKRRTLFLPEEALSNVAILQNLVKFVRANIYDPYRSTNLHMWFSAYDHESREKLAPVLAEMKSLKAFKGRVSMTTRYGHSGNEQETQRSFARRKLTYAFLNPQMPGSYKEGVFPHHTLLSNLKYGNNKLLFSPPETFRKRGGGVCIIDIESDIWRRYPRNHQIADAILRGSWFSRYGVSAMMQVYSRPFFLGFNLVDEWETLRLFFESKGFTIAPSKVSQYSDAVVNLIGGLTGVEVLATKAAYLLLDILALKSTKKISQRLAKELNLRAEQTGDIERVLDEFEVIPELQGIPKTYSNLCSDSRLQPYRKVLLDLLDRLTIAQVLKRGYFLPCPNCGASDWYPLQN